MALIPHGTVRNEFAKKHLPADRHGSGSRKAAVTRARKRDEHTRQELYAKAQRRHIEGRSKMTKRQLENALGTR
jgi:hypothetical protein